jgi:hypothetical protein
MCTAAATACCVYSSPTTSTSGLWLSAACSISCGCCSLLGTGRHRVAPMWGVGRPAHMPAPSQHIQAPCLLAEAHHDATLHSYLTLLGSHDRAAWQALRWFRHAHHYVHGWSPCMSLEQFAEPLALLQAYISWASRPSWQRQLTACPPPARFPVVSSIMTCSPSPPWSGLLLISRHMSRSRQALPTPGRPSTSRERGLQGTATDEGRWPCSRNNGGVCCRS